MFHGRISLIRVPLLLILNFVIVIVNFVNIRSSLIHICSFQLLVLQSLITKITFFVCTNSINLTSQENLVCKCFVSKGFLKLPNLLLLIRQESITSQKLGSRCFWQIAFNKNKSAILPPFNGTQVLSSAFDKIKFSAGIFCKDSTRKVLRISLPDLSFTNNLKLLNISATPKRSRTGCIPVVVLKNCQPELSISESCFLRLLGSVMYCSCV